MATTPFLNDIGFTPITTDEVLTLVQQNQQIGYFPDECIKGYDWLVFRGDLNISATHIPSFFGQNILIIGNLIVDGVFNHDQYGSLIVIGDMQADSALISSVDFCVSGIVKVKQALISSGGSGNTLCIHKITGPFVYNDSDSALIMNIHPDDVDTYFNSSTEEGFGDPRTLIRPEFLDWDDEYEEDDEYDEDEDEYEEDDDPSYLTSYLFHEIELHIEITDLEQALIEDKPVFLKPER